MTDVAVAKPRTLGWWCAGKLGDKPCGAFNGEAVHAHHVCRRCGTSRTESRRFLLERADERHIHDFWPDGAAPPADRAEHHHPVLLRQAIGVLRDVARAASGAGKAIDALSAALGPALPLPDDAPDHELALQAFQVLLDHEWGGDGGPCPECREPDSATGGTHLTACVWGAICDLLRRRGMKAAET